MKQEQSQSTLGSGGSGSSSHGSRDRVRLSEFFYLFKRQRHILILFASIMTIGAVMGHVFYIPFYTAHSKLLIQENQSDPLNEVAESELRQNYTISPAERIARYASYLRSSSFFLTLAESLKFQEEYQRLNLVSPHELSIFKPKFWELFFKSKDDKVGEVQPFSPILLPVEKISVILSTIFKVDVEGTNSIYISVNSLEPYTSMVVANTASDTFVKMMNEYDLNEINEVKKFIEERLHEATEKLKRDELRLVDFKRRNNIISINEESKSYAERLRHLDNEIEDNRLKLQENKRLIEFYQKHLATNDRKIIETGGSAELTPKEEAFQLRQRVETLKQQKILLDSQGYANDDWRVREVGEALSNTAKKLKANVDLKTGHDESIDLNLSPRDMLIKIEELKNENKQIDSKIAGYSNAREGLLKVADSFPKEEQELLALTRDVELQYDLYSSLKKKLQEVDIRRVALKSRIRVDEVASLPGPSARVNILLKIIFSVLAGTFMGCVLALIFEMFDSSVKHRSDLEDCELVVLGNIPHIKGAESKVLGEHGGRSKLLVCERDPDSADSMAFKYVRAQLRNLRNNDGKSIQTITITSADRAEGKSFFSSNMAVSFAQLDCKVILVDCDFRNPSVPKYFEYDNREGLVSLFSLKSSLSEVLIKGKVHNLDILPAGMIHPNPTELISGDKFRLLLQYLKSNYDYIILDAPPAMYMVDAAILAGLTDSVILVASHRKTKKDDLLMAHRKILQVSHKRVYGVLNNIKDGHEYVAYYTQPYFQAAQSRTPAQAQTALSRDSEIQEELKKFTDNLKRVKVG